MAPVITIKKVDGPFDIETETGHKIATVRNALELREGSYPPVLYFAREDLPMDMFMQSEFVSKCPWKGSATHFNLSVKNRIIDKAAWSYETPNPDVEQIKERLGFYSVVIVKKK